MSDRNYAKKGEALVIAASFDKDNEQQITRDTSCLWLCSFSRNEVEDGIQTT